MKTVQKSRILVPLPNIPINSPNSKILYLKTLRKYLVEEYASHPEVTAS